MLKICRVVYRLWHNLSAAGRIGYIGKDKYHPNRINLAKRSKERCCPKLYRALKKHPFKVWHKEILASCFYSDAALTKAEIFYIKKFNSKRKGYNCTDGGEGASGRFPSEKTRLKMSKAHSGENHYLWGKHHTTESRAKMSAAKKGDKHPNWGKKHSTETRAKMSKAQTGKKPSTETRAKIREALIGKKLPIETRVKMSKAQSGKNHPFWGKHLPAETRAKIGIANKNPSTETRARMSESKKGTTASTETRARMVSAQKVRWALRRLQLQQAA